ncbi:hypothetical protein [Aquibium sp. ELW1220]|uniref:hypothetical protein n=1 Tax=Aquibium sp. ELW1220 TaxID=2976766 RepID=UPI0025AFE20A|nr:hypothetical protein [Aquibium sp. ELW1220]MDN2584019.1 hypothetical protein [Aquibium sp. ELW1220]
MDRRATLLAIAAILSPWASSAARADCKCAANGTRYEMGAVVCIRSPAGSWLGRCGKVLNNSSWTKLGDGCPLTLEMRGEAPPLSHPAGPRPADLRRAISG